MSIKQTDQTYVASTYARADLVLVKGKGSLAWDENGKEYIDLGTGIGVNAFGYCDDEWIKAVSEQAGLLQHASNLYYTSPCARLAQVLCERTGMKKVFFANSGAEANECAIKVARKWGAQTKGENCYKIITIKNSFHGRTLATLSATGQDKFHELFNPLVDGFLHVSANDCEQLEKLVKENDVCAVMLETVQGEGGVNVLDVEFVQKISTLAKQENFLVMIDEVQTGNGRCGALYSYMDFGIMPDVVTTAKGLGGGLPIGACLMGEKVQSVLTAGTHGSTFGGNPVACAGALSIIERLTDDFLAQVKKKSELVFNKLSGAKGIESVSGKGLMIGIKTKRNVMEVLSECREKGVICLTAKDKIRLLPPLNIPFELLEKALSTIVEVCAK